MEWLETGKKVTYREKLAFCSGDDSQGYPYIHLYTKLLP